MRTKKLNIAYIDDLDQLAEAFTLYERNEPCAESAEEFTERLRPVIEWNDKFLDRFVVNPDTRYITIADCILYEEEGEKEEDEDSDYEWDFNDDIGFYDQNLF